MKQKMSCYLCLLLFFFVGCTENIVDGGDDRIWDFVNYDVMFVVTDGEGNDLLDQASAGYLDKENITVHYKEKVFSWENEGEVEETAEKISDEPIRTRENMPLPLAIRYYKSREGINMLAFGEFSPTSSYHDETFTVDWGDGTTDEVTFDLYITWDKKRDPTVHRKISLNGEFYSDTSFGIEIKK